LVRGKTFQQKKKAKEIVVVLGIFSYLKACPWSLLEVFFFNIYVYKHRKEVQNAQKIICIHLFNTIFYLLKFFF